MTITSLTPFATAVNLTATISKEAIGTYSVALNAGLARHASLNRDVLVDLEESDGRFLHLYSSAFLQSQKPYFGSAPTADGNLVIIHGVPLPADTAEGEMPCSLAMTEDGFRPHKLVITLRQRTDL